MKFCTSSFPKGFLVLFVIGWSLVAKGSITIDSVQTTRSTCANNGTITVYAHSISSLFYAIIAGPGIYPIQGSSTFGSLSAGTYKVLVTDLSNDSLYTTVIVNGNYTPPSFSPTYLNPNCPTSPTGIIVGNPTNNGTPPFTWALTNIGTGITINQSSDTFRNLIAGNYSLRIYDSCSNFATYSVTLTAPNTSFSTGSVTNSIFPCDSVDVGIAIYPANYNAALPYIFKFQTHNGTYIDTVYNVASSSVSEFVPGVSYGDYINITITNACGVSTYIPNTVAAFYIKNNYSLTQDSCQFGYYSNFFVTADSAQSNVNQTLMPDPVTIVVRNASTGALVDSTVTNDTLTHFSFNAYTNGIAGNNTYTVKLTDGCGHTSTQTIIWPSTVAASSTSFRIMESCQDSTSCIALQWNSTFNSVPTFQLLSGPNTLGSTKPDYSYHDTIIYPQTYLCQGNVNTFYLYLTDLPAGTYHYRISDSCGHTFLDSFVIRPQDLNIEQFKISCIKACPGNNIIIESNDIFSYTTLTNATTNSYVALTNPDTLTNLNYGTYILNLNYAIGGPVHPVNKNPTCFIVHDTVTIPPYTPPLVSYQNQIKCNGAVNVVFQPDSNTGVAPYKYEILSGPQTTGIQYSNIFALTLPGTYIARISDSCGFANTFTFTVDTSSLVEVLQVGASCLGSEVSFTSAYSPYVTYLWKNPTGITYTGDTLTINPIVVSDFGVYTLDKIVRINGCLDTFKTSFAFTGNIVTQISASVCPGQSILFGGLARSLAGNYYDTIQKLPCDSITELTLTIKGPVYDSVYQSICPGQSVTVGTHTYTSTGIYRDTFVTAGCDSIHILNLHMGSFSYDTITKAICQGTSFLFSGTSYSTAGTYYDSIPTASCDSIIVLKLSIIPLPYDSVAQSICPGQSVSVGIHNYSTTGIYHDTIPTAGCDSIHVLNLKVGSFSYDTISAAICQGTTIIFGTNTLSLPGTYYDTIPTASCDSIVLLKLTNIPLPYDSVVQNICPGQSVSVGAHSYSATGIYHDTIPTTGCDSIHVLNLKVGSFSYDTIPQAICQGSSFIFAGMSYAAGGFYYDTIPTAGCDSIVVLDLSIIPLPFDSVVQNICPGQSVTVGIHNYSTTGIYHDTIPTTGCDSIHVLNLHLNNFSYDTISKGICQGSSFLFSGISYSTAGTYYDTIPTVSCDSIIVLNLSIIPLPYDSVVQTICPGQSVAVGIHSYSSNGIYYDTIATIACDSIHVLNLTVGTFSYDTISTAICQGTTILFGTNTLSLPGTYYDTIPTVSCDSIVVLNLTNIPLLYDSGVQNICPGQSVSVGAHSYSATGIYYDTIPTAGCDSIHVLNLTVGSLTYTSIRQTLCLGQSISVGVHTYNASGTYQDTLSTSHCDSIITTYLTIITPALQTTDTNGICIAFYNSQSYSSDTSVLDTLTSQQGCDSIYLTTHIHIIIPTDTVINKSACIYTGQSYTIGGQSYSSPGIYPDTIRTIAGGCDSVITNTALQIISPQYIMKHIDSCYSATIGGVTYTADTIIRDTTSSLCGLDSVIVIDTLLFYDPSAIIISSTPLPIVAGEPTQLSISPSGDYQNILWGPDYEISNLFSPSPIVSPRHDTTYYVTAENAQHCTVSARILITVVGTDQPDFLMPTAFSPNGDGLNDLYRPVIKSGPVDVLSFEIYDRWGLKVYESENASETGWDGTYRNRPQPIGVYVYYITAKVSNGSIVRQSGNVTLVR